MFSEPCWVRPRHPGNVLRFGEAEFHDDPYLPIRNAEVGRRLKKGDWLRRRLIFLATLTSQSVLVPLF